MFGSHGKETGFKIQVVKRKFSKIHSLGPNENFELTPGWTSEESSFVHSSHTTKLASKWQSRGRKPANMTQNVPLTVPNNKGIALANISRTYRAML